MPQPPAKKEAQQIDPAKLSQVVKWFLSGAQTHDILETIKATYPEEVPAVLMLEAMRHFERAANYEPQVVHGWCFESAKDLYRQMVAAGDFAGALRAVKLLADMARTNVYDEPEEEEAAEGSDPKTIE